MKLEQSFSEEEKSPKHYAGGCGKMGSLIHIPFFQLNHVLKLAARTVVLTGDNLPRTSLVNRQIYLINIDHSNTFRLLRVL
jgi:hypothetical protein